MKILALLLLSCLALSNAAISQNQRANSYQHQNSFHSNSFVKKTPTKHYSATSSNGKDDKILRNSMEMKNDGSYNYQYETSNGITGAEHGLGGVSVQGSSNYISPEGIEIKTTYTADENGYHPVGDHIPKIPEYILRALEYIRTHPNKENEDVKRGSPKRVPISSHIVPPTHKTNVRKATPTPKRFVKAGGSNYNKYNSRRY